MSTTAVIVSNEQTVPVVATFTPKLDDQISYITRWTSKWSVDSIRLGGNLRATWAESKLQAIKNLFIAAIATIIAAAVTVVTGGIYGYCLISEYSRQKQNEAFFAGQGNVTQLTAEAIVAQEQAKVLSEQLETLKRDVRAALGNKNLQMTHKALQERVLEIYNEGLIKGNVAQNQQITDLNNTIAKQKQDIDNLTKTSNSLQKEVQHLTKTISQKDAEIHDLNAEVQKSSQQAQQQNVGNVQPDLNETDEPVSSDSDTETNTNNIINDESHANNSFVDAVFDPTE